MSNSSFVDRMNVITAIFEGKVFRVFRYSLGKQRGLLMDVKTNKKCNVHVVTSNFYSINIAKIHVQLATLEERESKCYLIDECFRTIAHYLKCNQIHASHALG